MFTSKDRIVGHTETLTHGAWVSLGHGFAAMVIVFIFTDPVSFVPALISFAIGTSFIFIAGLKNVPTHYRGIIKHFDKPQKGRLLDNGNHWIYPVPWVRSIELIPVSARRASGEVESTPFNFQLYDFMPIKAQVSPMRWRITDPNRAFDNFEKLHTDDEIMKYIHRAIRRLCQKRTHTLVDILGNISGTFADLKPMINEELSRRTTALEEFDDSIPVEIVQLGEPDLEVADPRFKEFVVSILMIDVWRRETKLSGEDFIASYLMNEKGQIRYGTHSLDIKSFLNQLLQYYGSK